MRRLASKNTIDLRDPKAREEFLMSEIMKANQKLAEGTLIHVLSWGFGYGYCLWNFHGAVLAT